MIDLDTLQEGFDLPAALDTQAASALLEKFITARGNDLRIGAADVQRVGGQCLQVLLAAQAAWVADANALSFENISPEFTAGLETLGVSIEAISHQKELVS
jgi:chemotaxis protein CheX